jgi:hypothetical protein
MQQSERIVSAPAPEMLSWGEAAVKCHRCKGAMIEEKFYGPGEPFFGLRCIVCGEILDSLILQNRNVNRGLKIFPTGREKGKGNRKTSVHNKART